MSGCSASEVITGPSWSRGNVIKLTAMLGNHLQQTHVLKIKNLTTNLRKLQGVKIGSLGLSFRRMLLSSVKSPTYNSKSASKKTELWI